MSLTRLPKRLHVGLYSLPEKEWGKGSDNVRSLKRGGEGGWDRDREKKRGRQSKRWRDRRNEGERERPNEKILSITQRYASKNARIKKWSTMIVSVSAQLVPVRVCMCV